MKTPLKLWRWIPLLLWICAVPSCLYRGFDTGSKRPFLNDHFSEKYDQWINVFPPYFIPRICEYYRLHPERFKPTGQGEEIAIKGLGDFVKNDEYFKRRGLRFTIVAGEIRDPWRDRLHFVQDLNMDGYINAAGLRVKVEDFSQPGAVEYSNYEHHFGYLKHRPFKIHDARAEEGLICRTYSQEKVQLPRRRTR